MARFNGSAGPVHFWAREPSRDAGTLGKAGVPRGSEFPARFPPVPARVALRSPTQTRFPAFGESSPSQHAAMGSPTPHHRSASPFPVPSISPPAGHPNALPAWAGTMPCVSRDPVWGPVTPPRRDRDAPSCISRLPSEQMSRSPGTCDHGPSCALPSVVNRWPQRGRWC